MPRQVIPPSDQRHPEGDHGSLVRFWPSKGRPTKNELDEEPD